MSYEIIKINETTYRIEDNNVRFFLLTGTKRALLIDSGLTVTNAREIAEGLTDLPVSLLNTHSDPDHIASNHQFESFYMHEAESFFYFNIMHKTGELIPLKDGEIIDLGDRPLEIVTLPGHTPGSGRLNISGYTCNLGCAQSCAFSMPDAAGPHITGSPLYICLYL